MGVAKDYEDDDEDEDEDSDLDEDDPAKAAWPAEQPNQRGKPAARDLGLLSINYGLLCGMSAF